MLPEWDLCTTALLHTLARAGSTWHGTHGLRDEMHARRLLHTSLAGWGLFDVYDLDRFARRDLYDLPDSAHVLYYLHEFRFFRPEGSIGSACFFRQEGSIGSA